jgi:cell shape-determining protein MreD
MRPNLILAAVVSVTILFGFGPGTVWAFVGGLTANLLTTDPLGSLSLGLLLVVAVTAGVSSVIGRSGLLVAVIGGALGSLILDVTALFAILLLGGAPPAQPAALAGLMLPAAIANGLLTLGVFVGARAVVERVHPASAMV